MVSQAARRGVTETVYGEVFYTHPLKPKADGILVRAVDERGKIIKQTRTKKGFYKIEGLPPRRYYIEVVLPTYVPSTWEDFTIEIPQEMHRRIDFALTME